jgi:hypothetical protein
MPSTITDGLYPRVSRTFARLSVSLLITFLRNVITQLTGNPAFPTPTPTLAVMSTSVDDLDAKNQAAINRGRLEVAARRAAKITTLAQARQLGNYVEARCNGSLETLLSSGFEAVRAPSPSIVPGVPGNARLTYNGTSGEMILRFTGDSNVKNFSVQHAESVMGPWIDHALSTSTRVKITDLTPGKMYWGRVRANGTAGSSDWCPATCLMAI